MTDPELVTFLQWALPRLGLRWAGFRNVRGQVRKRIARRMHELDVDRLDDYRARLEADAAEWEALRGLCLISISRFYRDRAIFEHVRRVLLPELATLAVARGEHVVRALSAGCASGEEPYTLAMMGRFELSPRSAGLALEVVAVDANAALLERARRGCYEASSLRELPADWREGAFETREGLFCVRAEIRALVDFRLGDLRAGIPEGSFDLVLCRNVAFTYFDEAHQREVAARFAEQTVAGGALVLGCHETLPPATPGWAPGPKGTQVWRRVEAV